jgi:uncharacterized protein DUF6719
MKYFRLTKVLIAVAVFTHHVAPVRAQVVKKEADVKQLSCGQKLLVDNNTCPADEILEVTGSCLNAASINDLVHAPRGTQYNCVKRKRE